MLSLLALCRVRSAVFAVSLVLLAFGLTTAHAQALPKPPSTEPKTAEDPLKATLTALQVVTEAQGKEVLKEARSVQPGEVIEYRLVYQNQGQQTLSKLVVDLPVPGGTSWIAGQAMPAPLQASLSASGGAFEAVPLMRTVKDKDGRDTKVAVPVSEYRMLRWLIGRLDAGKSLTFKARVRVNQEVVLESALPAVAR